MKPPLIVAGFALMTVLVLVGWMRKPAVEAPNFHSTAASAPATTEPAPPQPETEPATGHRDRLMKRGAEYAPRHRRVVVHERPLSHSAAIVGASAGTGAAIGALAGGGRGAGIGALVAGAGGFIYDRLTHEKKTVE